ncbi:MAG: PBECR4 domain-containing protein [Lactobacillus crispatus]|nr:PBECR4 domain-containing protein [Lactobacillus crispatus]
MPYLNYVKPTSRIFIKYSKSYKLATEDEVARLNKYEPIIKQVVEFYEKNLGDDKIDYIFKEENNIKILPVRYKKENFPHLTGINFDSKSALEKFSTLKYGNNDTPIIIERGDYTFKKLSVLHKIPDLIRADTTVLTQLKGVQQAKNINFSRGIKDSNSELLIALQDFQPEFYQPKSLLNIKDNLKYAQIPQNTVLGVFRERNISTGIHIEPISLNENSLDSMAVTTEVLIGMKKYADELGKRRIKERDISEEQQNLESNKEKKDTEKLTIKVDSRAREIALRRMREQGLER